jgi:superfamily II DNA or RNA helicase
LGGLILRRKMFQLRDYQKKALSVIDSDFKTQQNVLCSAIMGAGKTVLASQLIAKYWHTTSRRFLILAHKHELVEQFYKTLFQSLL